MMDFGYPYGYGPGYGPYRRRPTEEDQIRAYQLRQRQLAEAEEQRRLAYQQRLQEQQAYQQRRQEQLAYQQQLREQRELEARLAQQAKRQAEKQRRQELFQAYTAAATKIQSVWRGHRTRAEMQPLRAEAAYLAGAAAEVAQDVAAFEAAVAGLDWVVENTRAVEQTVLGFEHGMTRRLLELDSHSTHGCEELRRRRRQLAGSIDRHCADIEPMKQRLAGLVAEYRRRQDARVQAELQAERELSEQKEKEEQEQEQQAEEEQAPPRSPVQSSEPEQSDSESSSASQESESEAEDKMEEDEALVQAQAEPELVDRMSLEEPKSELEVLRRTVKEQAAEIAYLRSLLGRVSN